MNLPPFTVCIPSGGVGARMQSALPKQYLRIGGRPILSHALAVFDAMPDCREIVIAADDPAAVETALGDFPLRRPWRVVPGGETRQDSVRAALDAVPDSDEIVLVHDAARPCVAAGDVARVVEAVAEFGAAILAIPATDTMKIVANGYVAETVDRSILWHAQTPQGARASVFHESFARVERDGVVATDEASVMEYSRCRVRVVEGSRLNIKVTTPDDLALCETILRLQGRL